MAHDVFISHSQKDKTVADAVCSALEDGQHRCWMAPRDVLPGADWGSAIVDAIKSARVMVLIFSAESNDSDQVRREVQTAASHGVAILPFRIEDVKPSTSLEYFLGAQHWLDAMTPPMEDHLKRLRQVVATLLAKTGAEPVAAQAASPAADASSTPEATTPPGPTASPLLGKFALVGLGVVATLVILGVFSLLRGEPAQETTPVTTTQQPPQKQTRATESPPPIDPAPPKPAPTAEPPTQATTTTLEPGEGEAPAEPNPPTLQPAWDPGEPPPARTLRFQENTSL